MPIINFWSTWIASYARARFGRTERGASVVEYLLLVSLIAIALIGGLTVFGGKTSGAFEDAGSRLG